MNMHGIFTPVVDEATHRSVSRTRQLAAWFRRTRMFWLCVVLPTAVAGAYLYLVSADQYESEAHFLVRSTEQSPIPGTGVSQFLSMASGLSSAQGEAMSVADYLTSHDVVSALRAQDALVERFNRPEADILSSLHNMRPTPERLLKFYRKQVAVQYNSETGITTLRVRSFRPDDSYQILRKLLELGERRVNVLNVRSFNDAIAMSRTQLAEAEDALAASQAQLTHFRQSRGDIDPQASGQAQIGLVTTLTAQLSAAQAQLAAMGAMISHDAPQYRALAGRVTALRNQVGAQSGRLTGGRQAIANDISGYEGLRLRSEFLAKRYEAAASSLEKAREQAIRQQLYVVRVVDANMPVKSLYPERGRIMLTLLVALLLAYAIGWLIVAGVREHAA